MDAEPLGHDFPRALFSPSSTYHRISSFSFFFLSHSHAQRTDQRQDRRICLSSSHSLAWPRTRAMLCNPGLPQNTDTDTDRRTQRTHAANAEILRERLTRKGERLATNLGDCLAVAASLRIVGAAALEFPSSEFRGGAGASHALARLPVPGLAGFATLGQRKLGWDTGLQGATLNMRH